MNMRMVQTVLLGVLLGFNGNALPLQKDGKQGDIWNRYLLRTPQLLFTIEGSFISVGEMGGASSKCIFLSATMEITYI